MQASPHDPENFPFVVLGNKIDMEESKRMVCSLFFLTLSLPPLVPFPPHPPRTPELTIRFRKNAP